MSVENDSPEIPDPLPPEDPSDLQRDRDEEMATFLDPKEVVVPHIGGKMPKHIAKVVKDFKAVERAKKKKTNTLLPWEFMGLEPPQKVWANTTVGDMEVKLPNSTATTKGYLMLAGRGSKETPIDVLFVAPCATQAEYKILKQEPRLLRCASGNLFLRNLERAQWEGDDERRVKWYYTAIAKYCTEKSKLKPEDINWGLPALEDEIKTLNPKVIVCLSKAVFEFFIPNTRLAAKDIMGGFFRSEKYGVTVCLIDSVHVVLKRPEYTDRFLTDLRNIRDFVHSTKGFNAVQVTQTYTTISKATELFNVLGQLKLKQIQAMAVDCEWHGRTAWGGKLRSMQFCWAPGHAAYLRLMGEKATWEFDRPIEVVRQILAPVFNDPKMKFIGHNASADMPWMQDHLGIDVYQKFIFDTMYAQHTLNEYADMKLERLAIKYTDLGRYDLELNAYKKLKKFDEEDNEGYGYIPDRIIIPYGCRDVDATFRARFPLYCELRTQGLLAYYNNLLLPFVTDGFHEMMTQGLPINREFLDEQRETFTRNRDMLIENFRRAMIIEARYYLNKAIEKMAPDRCQDVALEIHKLMEERTPEATAQAEAVFKGCFRSVNGSRHQDNEAMMPVFIHYLEAGSFNINSGDQLKRWLFNVKGKTPIKTTKRDGYFLSWAKFMQMDEAKRSELKPEPSTDKQVIKIYAGEDPMVAQLQELQAIANITKAFLKGADPETGKEQGIHRWIQEDGRIHCNFALTETARPRAWFPNILNWPKAITKPIETGFKRINDQFAADLQKKLDLLQPENAADRAAIEAQVRREIRNPTSLRSNVCAPEGFCIVDMDLKTAEVVSLAYQSGDKNMIKVLTEPDTQFARIDKDNPKKVVRIAYNSNEGIPESAWDPKLLTPMDDPRILRSAEGLILHPKRDLHWEMGCAVAGLPREKCDERMTRDGCGKVGNFSIPYGATAGLLERMIEANTGLTPPEKTGTDLVRRWEEKYPDALKFLQSMVECVKSPGYFRAMSGRVRHYQFAELEDLDFFEESESKSVLAGIGRQARNFPMQENVAATTSKALIRWLREKRERGLHGRIGILLYDAMTAFVPLTELKATLPVLRDCLTVWNPWNTPGGTFHFEVDTTIGFRWGVKATAEEKKVIEHYLK